MSLIGMSLDPVQLPDGCQALRQEVRAFIEDEINIGTFAPCCDSWLIGSNPEFSKKLGAKGWLGMTWPKDAGGHGRSALERFVVIEELLQAGAPVACHWVADRQSGPNLLRFGSEYLQDKYLPGIVRGECYFAIGMSEPGTGSDLASVQTRGQKVDGGWIVSGTKVWTSQAHLSHALILLCRTEVLGRDRHAGLSQLIVDTDSVGVRINPIRLLTGEHHFNEVVLEKVFVPDVQVLGSPGDGWQQVTSELALERSGPERFLSTYPLMRELVRVLGEHPELNECVAIGELTAELWSLRTLSLAVAAALGRGESPDVEAALVKDIGTTFENKVIRVVRALFDLSPSLQGVNTINCLAAQAVLQSPGFTLRGGTSEILRGVVARGLGLR